MPTILGEPTDKDFHQYPFGRLNECIIDNVLIEQSWDPKRPDSDCRPSHLLLGNNSTLSWRV
jgi:hypothetical protein